MKTPSAKLINILIGKAIIETLLVGALAVGFNFSTFPPTFHGWGEVVPSNKTIAGWAVNDASPFDRLEVQLFIDGKYQAQQVAEHSRKDVVNAGWAKDEWHGYSFNLPSLTQGEHEARIFAVHQSGDGARYTLTLLGDPIRFDVGSSGVVSAR
jgi:hypothetical protein